MMRHAVRSLRWLGFAGLALVLTACPGAAPGVQSVTVDAPSMSVAVGETLRLSARVQAHASASNEVAWSSDDPDTATVDGSGLVTGVAAGTAAITATSEADPSKSDTIDITVEAAGIGGELMPGGTLTTDEGIVLGAVDEAIDASVHVFTEIAPNPTNEVPLPVEVQAHGRFYRIGATEDVTTADRSPLLVGIPVPEGAPSAKLALGMLVPKEDITYSVIGEEHVEPIDSWIVLGGQYDPTHGLFVTNVNFLATEGRLFVLVSGEDYDSPVASSISQEDGFGLSPEQLVPDFDFEARCVGFTALGRGNECTSNDETTMGAELEGVHEDLQQLGFKLPRLRKEFTSISLFPPSVFDATYVMELRPFRTSADYDGVCKVNANGAGNHGRYTSRDRNAVVCWGQPVSSRSNYLDGRIDILRHEYFHAMQYAYTTSAASWFKESTAVVAQDSLTSMVRSTGRPVRDVDVPLNGASQKYSLQDFWIYLGFRYGLGLDDLIPFLEEGGNTAGVETVLQQDYPDLGNIGTASWEWAKNQTFEKQFPLGGKGFSALCDLDMSEGRYYALKGAPEVIAYDHAAPPDDRRFAVPPLTSKVLQLDLGALPAFTYSLAIETDAPSPIKTKYYDPRDAGTTGCYDRFEARTHSVDVSSGQSETRYLLISNTSTASSHTATVKFPSGDPSLEIQGPAANSTFAEGDAIPFSAIATGFKGADPELVLIYWTYERYDGVQTLIGGTSSGEVLETDRFCDGTYTVTARATDHGSSRTAADSVTFSVTNASPPPIQCAPSVTILEPRSKGEQTYPAGETISLLAEIDDDHPETDEPIRPVTWRIDGPSGGIIGSGLSSSTKLGEGTHIVYVEYGTASDAVVIEVVGTTNTIPTAQVTSPEDGAQYFWYDYPSCNLDVAVTGSGSDPEDGVLTGSSLAWKYRSSTTPGAWSDWFGLGTGEQADLSIRCGITYQVKLTVQDSGGLKDSDMIQLEFVAPPD